MLCRKGKWLVGLALATLASLLLFSSVGRDTLLHVQNGRLVHMYLNGAPVLTKGPPSILASTSSNSSVSTNGKNGFTKGSSVSHATPKSEPNSKGESNTKTTSESKDEVINQDKSNDSIKAKDQNKKVSVSQSESSPKSESNKATGSKDATNGVSSSANKTQNSTSLATTIKYTEKAYNFIPSDEKRTGLFFLKVRISVFIFYYKNVTCLVTEKNVEN